MDTPPPTGTDDDIAPRIRVAVDAGELVACAARAGLRSSGGAPDPDQPVRALSTLLVDGLITTDDDGASYRLP